MTPHGDLLDQRDPMGRWLAGSLVLHVAALGSVVVMSFIGPSKTNWGDPNGGGLGAVAVNPVASIPLPSRAGPQNPVANDTESRVPEPPPKAKPQPVAKTPPPDAIPLKSRNAVKKATREPAAAPNRFRALQKDEPNQLYNTGGQSVSSQMYNMPGGGGVGVGTNSPFGQQFGAYATLLRDQVARFWKTNDVDPRLQTAPAVVVVFTLRRDGSVVPASVKLSQRSGNAALDFSAQRAVLDAAPFPQLPGAFPRSEAEIELRFELRR